MAATAPRPSLPLFGKTLFISLLLHLSAITLFSIVIYFPKQNIHYFRLAFVTEPAATPEVPVDGTTGPTKIAALMVQSKRGATQESFTLPVITDGTPGVGALHVGGHSFFEEPAQGTPDSWARFGQGIQEVRSSILGLAGVPPLRLGGEGQTTEATPTATLDFGGGLHAELDWGSNSPREVLFRPPVLFSVSPPAGGVEYFVTVSSSGTVSSAVAVSTNPRTIVTDVSGAYVEDLGQVFNKEAVAFLRGCRFAPGTRAQSSNLTVRVSATKEGAAP